MKTQHEVELRARIDDLVAELSTHDQVTPQKRRLSSTEEREILGLFDDSTSSLQDENSKLKSELDDSVRENRRLMQKLEEWRTKLETEKIPDDPDETSLQSELKQAIAILQIKDLKCDELSQENLQLLKERDTLQLKLSNMMRRYEKQKETSARSSRASTRTTTPVPFTATVLEHFDPSAEIRDLHLNSLVTTPSGLICLLHRRGSKTFSHSHSLLDELRKLNYALDV